MKERLETYIAKRGSDFGAFVDFPTTAKELRAKFKKLNIEKDDWQILAVKTGDDSFGKAIINCHDLDELNYLGYWISQFDANEYRLFFEFASAGCADGTTVCDYINLAANLKACYRVKVFKTNWSLANGASHSTKKRWDIQFHHFGKRRLRILKT